MAEQRDKERLDALRERLDALRAMVSLKDDPNYAKLVDWTRSLLRDSTKVALSGVPTHEGEVLRTMARGEVHLLKKMLEYMESPREFHEKLSKGMKPRTPEGLGA